MLLPAAAKTSESIQWIFFGGIPALLRSRYTENKPSAITPPRMAEHTVQPEESSPTRSATRRLWWVIAGLLVVIASLGAWLGRRTHGTSERTRWEHAFWVVGHASSSPQLRTVALLELVVAGNHEWRGAHLDGLQLDNVSLPGAYLVEADFKNSSLARAKLAKARLAKTRLELADLSDADLTGADLSGSLMLRAKLQRAQLSQANLRGAVLEQAEAQGASFLMADLANGYLLMANLSQAKLGGASLIDANLEAANFRGADLSLTRLNNTNLKDADFTDCNWWRARGLSAPQLELLEQKFKPTEKWPAALRADFQEWSARRAEIPPAESAPRNLR